MLSGRRSTSKDRLDDIWKEVLLYQFHDVLPGSSIDRVYDESRERCRKILTELEYSTVDIYNSVFDRAGEGFTAVNTAPYRRSEWIKHGGEWFFVTVPPMGYAAITEAASPEKAVYAADSTLSNDELKITFNLDGTVASVLDIRTGREYISGDSNVLEIYEDNGNAWDFSILARDMARKRCKLIKSEYYTDGPAAVCEHTFAVGSSEIVQKIVLTLGSRRVDFVTRVDWWETHKMLRTSFAANVMTNHVTCDIQFGNIKRTNNTNTMIDTAQYEICAHKWIDLSQADYGVSLLNNCKYGHSVNGNIMDINLLRSTTAPGETADKGVHEFTYSFYPHEGGTNAGGTDAEGYKLNMPVRCIDKLPPKNSFSLVKTDKSNIVVETVKYAEDGDDIIIRAYENSGARARAVFTLGIDIDGAYLTDMTEENPRRIDADKNSFSVDFNPFEINTIRLKKAVNK